MIKSPTGMVEAMKHSRPDFNPVELRRSVMEAAGFDVTYLGNKLRRNMEKLAELQEVTKTEYYTYQGEVCDEREVADNATQLKATMAMNDLITNITAMNIRQQAAPAEIPDVNFVLNIPWLEDSLARNAAKDVTPHPTASENNGPDLP